MTSIELAHPHDHLARRFLIDPELMADLLAHYPKKAADQQTIRLIDLSRLECKSPVTIDEQLIKGIGDLRFSTSFKGENRQSNVFLLFEHQSSIDQRMRIALLANHRNITTLSQARINPLSHIRRIRKRLQIVFVSGMRSPRLSPRKSWKEIPKKFFTISERDVLFNFIPTT